MQKILLLMQQHDVQKPRIGAFFIGLEENLRKSGLAWRGGSGLTATGKLAKAVSSMQRHWFSMGAKAPPYPATGQEKPASRC
jgi:hypothetical protein